MRKKYSGDHQNFHQRFMASSTAFAMPTMKFWKDERDR